MSYTRKIFTSFMLFGLFMGLIFPFYASLFVTMKEGMGLFFIVGCVMAGLLLGFMNYIIYRVIVGRIVQRLSHTFTQIADGNLMEEVTLQSKDQFGQLTEAIDRMRRHLLAVVSELSRGIERLTTMGKQLSAVTGQTEILSEEVLNKMNEVSTNSDRQAMETGTILQRVEKAYEQINLGHSLMEKTVADQLASNQGIEQGRNRIYHSLKQLEAIQDILTYATDSMNILSERTLQIAEIATTISDISKQTHMLALNASIEAARAGEHGAGFSVVSAEIRLLADGVQQAVQEIDEVTKRIATETKERTQVLASDFAHVEQYMVALREGERALTQSTEKVGETEEAMTDVATILEDFRRDLQHTLNSVRQITEIASASTLSVQIAAEQTGEQQKQIERSASFSQEMARLARKLEKQVEKFQFSKEV